jgi:hypothetical protein
MPRRSDRQTSSRAALLAALVLASGAIGAASLARAADAPARPTIYRWIDENGIPHYTAHRSRIPSGLRERATEVAPAAPATPGAAASERWIGRDAGEAPSGSPAPPADTESGAREATGFAPSPAAAPSSASASARDTGTTRAASPPGASDLDGRIASLEREIEKDEAALQDLLAAGPRGDAPMADQAEFREIAKRLPQRQAELRGLLEQRSRLGRP